MVTKQRKNTQLNIHTHGNNLSSEITCPLFNRALILNPTFLTTRESILNLFMFYTWKDCAWLDNVHKT